MIVKPFDKSLLVMRELPLLGMHQAMDELLRMHFDHEEDVYVFNHVTLPKDEGGTVTLDHLILTRWGIFMIHNFHVEHILSITRQSGWTVRDSNGVERHIQSPYEAAKLKECHIRRLLNAHAPRLLPRFLGMQQYFGTFPTESIVAVNDNATISRDIAERGPNVLNQQAALPATYKCMTELQIHAEYYWLTRWFTDTPRVLDRQTTFDIACLIQAQDQKPSKLSPLLIAGLAMEPSHSDSGSYNMY